jgi:hypothetical protein
MQLCCEKGEALFINDLAYYAAKKSLINIRHRFKSLAFYFDRNMGPLTALRQDRPIFCRFSSVIVECHAHIRQAFVFAEDMGNQSRKKTLNKRYPFLQTNSSQGAQTRQDF